MPYVTPSTEAHGIETSRANLHRYSPTLRLDEALAQLEQERAKVAALVEALTQPCLKGCFSGGCETCWRSGCDHHGPIPVVDDLSQAAADHDAKVAREAVEAERERLLETGGLLSVERIAAALHAIQDPDLPAISLRQRQTATALRAALLSPESDSKEGPTGEVEG